MASVAGLAPAKVCLKDRARELLCIHGRSECRIENEECRISEGRPIILHFEFCTLHLKVVPEVGIAPTSPRLQRGANLPQLLGGWPENGLMDTWIMAMRDIASVVH